MRLAQAIVGVGGVCAALATLYVTFRGFDDRDANRLIRFWTSVGVLIGLAFWILYVITGYKGP